MIPTVIFSLYVFLLPFVIEKPGEDWSDWRGKDRLGEWNEDGVITHFDAERIPLKWSAPLSAGYSGPTVSEGRVYVTDRILKLLQERVLCFDAESGAEVWTHAYPSEYYGVGYPAGPRSSVVIDGGKAFSLGTMGHLICFEKGNGEVIWQKDLNEIYEIRMPTWGISAAPLIVENKIILNIGGTENACVVALDKQSGEEIWRNLEDETSYSAPILIDQAGKEVLVVWTGERIVGMDPASGEVYWAQVFEQKRMIMNISTPVLSGPYMLLSNFFDGSMLLKLDDEKMDVSVVWQRGGKNERNTDALHSCISTPVILGDYIYGVDSYGELRCLELLTGDRVWEDLTAVKRARWANIHFVQNGKLNYMFNENGELIVAELNEKGFKEISRALLIEPTTEQLNRSGEGVTWAHPAFANKHVFVRSDTELVCADLSIK